MNKDLLKVSIRQNAIYLPLIEEEKKQEELTSTTIALVAQLRKVGYSLSEELLHAINQLYPAQQMMILQVMKEALGVTLNWSPLVKGWDVPTGETRLDHLVTWIANLFNSQKGVKLPCGHVILIIHSLWNDTMVVRSAEPCSKRLLRNISDREVN